MEGLSERVAAVEAEVRALREWQARQNGSLQRVEEKLDRAVWGMFVLVAGVAANLMLVLMKG